ncbi:YdaU family protein [Mesorhizobium sp. 2RAF45]|uniref:YdaU family protein n=1 Tax=Mesorhizobium sp. 2RAF45 TaxID=3233001 RepID=UPI003F95396B
MSERPFMQLYVSDFVGDTLPLSTEQIGAYMLILMAMWNAGGRLPDDDAKLARVARLSLKRWRAISVDLLSFFEREAGEIGHKRLTRELHKAQVKSEARAAAGARGGTATALKTKAHGAANAGVLPRHSPDSRNQSEKASAFSPENAQHFSTHGDQEVAGGSSENAQHLSPAAGRNRPTPGFSRKKPGWQRPKTHTDAANAIIEEIRSHDRSRTAAGDESAGRDVLMLPAIRPD